MGFKVSVTGGLELDTIKLFKDLDISKVSKFHQ